MSDSLEQVLYDLRFEVPEGLVERVKRSATPTDRSVRDRRGEQVYSGEIEETDTRRIGRMRRRIDANPHNAQALIAALLAVAIVLSLVFAARALHPAPPIPSKLGPVPSATPIPIGPPATSPCGSTTCGGPDPVFASPTVGWIERGNNLFRTDDGGVNWRAMVSWSNPPVGAGPIRSR
jgi:hypothetical protein